jgi:hypothetical protein
VGEAKRRQKLDPNFGKSNVLGNACQHVDELLFQLEQTDPDEVTVFSLFTNDDRGCSEQEFQFLKMKLPQFYQGKKFTIWILPKQYASLSLEEAFEHFIPLKVGAGG